MMALEEEIVTKEAPSDEGRLSKEEEDDLAIAVMLAQNMIDEQGISVIDTALEESNDPGQVIGQFLMQLVTQMHENLPPDVELSKRVYFAKGGWIEQISDYLQDEYDIPRDVMDRAEMFIGAQAESMAQGAAQQGMAGQQPTSAPNMPPAGGMA
jgi:hypothetical protein